MFLSINWCKQHSLFANTSNESLWSEFDKTITFHYTEVIHQAFSSNFAFIVTFWILNNKKIHFAALKYAILFCYISSYSNSIPFNGKWSKTWSSLYTKKAWTYSDFLLLQRIEATSIPEPFRVLPAVGLWWTTRSASTATTRTESWARRRSSSAVRLPSTKFRRHSCQTWPSTEICRQVM